MQIDLIPDSSLLVIMAIFIANYFVVRKFFLEPVNAVIVARETEIAEADALFQGSMARMAQATSDVEAKLLQARREGALVRERSRAEATSHRDSVVETTRQKASEIVATAEQSLQSDVAAARSRIVSDSEQLARDAAERILGRKLK